MVKGFEIEDLLSGVDTLSLINEPPDEIVELGEHQPLTALEIARIRWSRADLMASIALPKLRSAQ